MRSAPPFPHPTRLDRDVDLAGIRLRVHDWPGGRGPVICLPGQTATGRSFDALGSALSPEWRVLGVDLRGRGESAKPPFGYGYQIAAMDALALIEQFGFERPVLLGHSYGAIIALLVAAWHPARIGGVVLVDGGAAITPAVRAAVDLIVQRLDTVYPSIDAYLGLLRQAPWLQPWTPELETYFRATVEQALDGGVRSRTAKHAIEEEVRTYWSGPPDYATLYRTVQCPTLVVRATGGGLMTRDDLVLPDADYQAMLAGLTNARGVEIANANHYTVMLGSAERTVAAVRTFLESLPATS